MTGDEFRSRYQLGERLTESPVVTHRATDDAGNFVMVHFLLGSPEVSQASLLQKVRDSHDTSPPVRDRVLEITESQGVTVVVTQVLEEFSGLLEWLEGHGRAEEAPRTDSKSRCFPA